MIRAPGTRVDPARCIGCGICVQVCPDETLSIVDGIAQVTGDHSLSCGHCAAVCPVSAITVETQGASPTQAFPLNNLAVPAPSLDALLRLMSERRSVRYYRSEPVPLDQLNMLIQAGILAPSGTNSQAWSFTVIPKREDVLALGAAMGDWFRQLNRRSESRLWRAASRLFVPGDPLGRYYREHHDAVEGALRQFEESGRDRLFHGAPSLIIVGARPGGSTPAEDALLAAQNILLAASAMGLGTCLIGFAVEAFQRAPTLKALAGIPKDEQVYAVVALGFPAIRYLRPTGRRTPPIRVTHLSAGTPR